MEQEKLYSPLGFYLRDTEAALEGQYDEMQYWRDELTHEEAFSYIDQIEAHLSRDRQQYDNGRGLMEYYGDGPLDSKVQSLIPHVELHGDKLWTVADVRLNEPLTTMEMADLKSWWGGQLSDGWGEGLEQREIKVGQGDLYIEPWTASAGFFIATQAEFDRRMGIEAPAAEKRLPDLDAADRIDSKKAELFSRLDKNLSDYCEGLTDTDERELIGMAEDIASRFGVRDYLKNDHHFKELELDFLLGFRDPLEVVSEHTPPIPTLLEMSGGISELANLEGALRREYPLAQEYTALRDALDDRDAQLTQIAQKHCHVETLETRKSDSLDFHDVSVWGLKAALEEAFKAGAEHSREIVAEMPNRESPAKAALHEPDAFVDGKTAVLRYLLGARLEANLNDCFNMIRNKYNENLAGMTSELGARMDAFHYLTEIHNFHTSELQYLLQFENPLAVVADEFANEDISRSNTMWRIFDEQEALRGDYARAPDSIVANAIDAESMREELSDRLDQNYAEMMNDYRSDISDGKLPSHEVVALAERITHVSAAYQYLGDNELPADQVSYLLNFRCPLEVVADRWPAASGGLVDMNAILWDICDKEDTLQGDYPLAEVTILVAERGKPTEIRTIPNDRNAIADIIGGTPETQGGSDPIQHYFNGNIDPTDFDDAQISRILPDGAVVGPLVVAARDESSGRFRSLTPDEISTLRTELDAPQHQPEYAEMPAAKDTSHASAQGKRSLLAGLREAQAQKEPPKEKPNTHKSGPEL